MTKEFKEHVSRLMKRLVNDMFLNEWAIAIVWMSKDYAGDDETTARNADITHDPDYLYATLRIYPNTYRNYKAGMFRTVADIVCHELAHIIGSPLQTFARQAVCPANQEFFTRVVENQTQRITNTIIQLLPRSVIYPAKPKQKPVKKSKAKKAKRATD